MKRLLLLLGFTSAISFGPLAQQAAPGSPPVLLITGLNAGDAPQRVQADAPRAAHADSVLWQEGRPLGMVRSGQTIPKALPAGDALAVTVADAAGKPAAGLALQWKTQGLPNLPEPFGRARTDDRGAATVAVEPGKGTLLWVDDPAYLPMQALIAAGTRAVDLLAVPAQERVLLVRDAYGRSLAGAQVKAMPLDSLSDPLHAARNRGTLVKQLAGDGVGRVVLPRDLGRVCACAWVPGCTVGDLPSVDGGRTVVLQPARPVQVRVTAAETKTPVKPVQFEATFASARIPWMVFAEKGTWAEGAGAIVPGAYECKLTLKAEGWADLTQRLAEPPPDGRLDLALQRGVTLAGAVVDTAGVPVAKAYVETSAGWDGLSAETDATGSFELKGVARSDAPLTLYAGADGFLDKEVPGVPAQETRSLRIALDRGGAVVGRVVDGETREPVADAGVAFMTRSGNGSRGPGFQVKVGADGVFRAAGLDPGAYDVRAWAPASAAALRTATIVGAETVDLGEIALSDHPAVKGRLQDDEGHPPSPSAQVRLERIITFKEVAAETAVKTLPGTVAQDGSFAVRGVASGSYRVVAEDGDAKRVLGPVAVDRDDVDLGTVDLTRAASLDGRLMSRSGQDLGSWRVALLTQTFDFDPATAYTDDGGHFSFDDLPAGVYYLNAYPPLKMVPEAQQRIGLTAGGHSDVVIPIGGVTLAVFLTVDGTPASGASVRVGGPSDSLFETGVVGLWSEMGKVVLGLPAGIRTGAADATGRVVLEGVTPGPGLASLTLNSLTYNLPVTIPADAQAPVTWDFKGLQVSGRVLRPDGAPGAGLVVAVGYSGVGAMPGTGTSADAEGAFHITGLGEGAITLGCRDEAGNAATATVTLAAGEPAAPVTLQLKVVGSGQSNGK